MTTLSVLHSLCPGAQAASAVLSEQIEQMQGNQVALIACGVKAALAQILVVAIDRGSADMSDLREHGVDVKAAVAICEAVAARRARFDAAVARIDVMPKSGPIGPGAQPPPLPLPKPIAQQAPAGILIPPQRLGRPFFPPPEAAAPAPSISTRESDRLSALSLLHTLACQCDTSRGDATALHHAGFSLATSKELADLINETR